MFTITVQAIPRTGSLVTIIVVNERECVSTMFRAELSTINRDTLFDVITQKIQESKNQDVKKLLDQGALCIGVGVEVQEKNYTLYRT